MAELGSVTVKVTLDTVDVVRQLREMADRLEAMNGERPIIEPLKMDGTKF